MAWIGAFQQWLTESESLNNAMMVAIHLHQTGWHAKSIAAVCGNMRHESSINPKMYEYGYDWSADRGYGLVQWTPRSKYWDWAMSRGMDPAHGDSQLARIDYEIANNIQWITVAPYNMSFNEFKVNSQNWSVDYLTEAFCWSYERPLQSAGEQSMPARKSFAALVYASFSPGSSTVLTVPIDGATPANITSPYGWRTDPISGQLAFHDAIDFGFPCGTTVLAAASGRVVTKVYPNPDQNIGEDNWLQIDHGNGYVTTYHHLRSISVNLDDVLVGGQPIGSVGSTGYSTGCHLHFSLYKDGSPMDPYPYLFKGATLPIDGGGPIIPGRGLPHRWTTNMRRDLRRLWKGKSR